MQSDETISLSMVSFYLIIKFGFSEAEGLKPRCGELKVAHKNKVSHAEKKRANDGKAMKRYRYRWHHSVYLIIIKFAI